MNDIKKEFEEKFWCINLLKRSEELDSAFYSNYEIPPLEDSPPVKKFKRAIKAFINAYEEQTGKKLDQKYYVCNQDEPYAQAIIDIILSDGKWIEQKLSEAKIEVLRKVYVNIYTKDEIPNIILQLEKK